MPPHRSQAGTVLPGLTIISAWHSSQRSRSPRASGIVSPVSTMVRFASWGPEHRPGDRRDAMVPAPSRQKPVLTPRPTMITLFSLAP